MEPTILIKVEEPTGDCQKCFYYQSDSDGGHECCSRPSEASQNDCCFEFEPGGKITFSPNKRINIF